MSTMRNIYVVLYGVIQSVTYELINRILYTKYKYQHTSKYKCRCSE